MAEHVYRGSNGNISPVGNDIARPSTSDEPKLALTMPDRKTQRHDAIEGWKSASLKRSFNLVRPSTAPLGLRGVPKVSPKAPNLSRPTRVFGKLSLFDAEIDKEAHSYLGPKVLRDMGEPRLGFALQSPDNFLKVGDGQSLRTRVAMKELLKKYPVNRDPPFRKGNGGVRLSWQSVPMAASLFHYLYDNGTLDFISMRWTNTGNEAVWGCKEKSGRVHWGQRPVDVEIARWLPIFLEGIREYQVMWNDMHQKKEVSVK
ncbi:hypothetical protein CEUSTIGMA_g8232.t1 [Chlamydomonas eustigma]|uniref:Uncharacterized protein n=1 Tax=Chlamydomonas eustigma TaxID=1157962 RepID=A0A250XCL1_9CHLO|nr:hypothetical protein CEUSTIGMA_g8232.t1 [Chlamydomonas eustigma]|eukprot:GAX80796.1 hypothetical protein CEUSTIGMA_g8232.t1 [Chlamydomonas eustigma]